MGFPMHPLDKALGDITSIRRQVARTTEFRGYGALRSRPPASSPSSRPRRSRSWLPDPADHILVYLAIWVTTAIISATLIGVQTRHAHAPHPLRHGRRNDPHGRRAVPALRRRRCAALTLVLIRSVPSAFWMLPGLWQIIFSLGVFSSCRFLPRPMIAAGAWYLLDRPHLPRLADNRALSPWTMGIAYGSRPAPRRRHPPLHLKGDRDAN